jgi:diketogulonate reductase-like aldo/keto reductase
MRYDAVLKACEKSLRRLQTNYIDLYQVHFPSGRVTFKETMSAMEKLVEKGKIRHIGVSNFSLAQMLEAEGAMSKYELASTQMNYSLAHREIEKDIMRHCDLKR